MRPLVYNCILDSRQTIENHGAGAAFDVVDGCLHERRADEDWDGPFVGGLEYVGHFDVMVVVKLVCGENGSCG